MMLEPKDSRDCRVTVKRHFDAGRVVAILLRRSNGGKNGKFKVYDSCRLY